MSYQGSHRTRDREVLNYLPPRTAESYKKYVDDTLLVRLAQDLYELHCETGISLDKWDSARAFVEFYYGPIRNNNA
jgi:hypothetical protein